MSSSTRYLLIILGVAFLLVVLWFLKSIVAYILIAAVLSIIGHPMVDFLNKIKIGKFRIPAALSAALSLASLWLVVISFFRIFIPIVFSQAKAISEVNPQKLAQNLEEPLNYFESILTKLNIQQISNESIHNTIVAKILTVFNISDLSNIFGSAVGILGNLLVAFFAVSFISFFFLKEKKLFLKIILIFVPVKHFDNVINVLDSIKKLLTRYFIGICIDALLVIAMITIGLTIVGLDLQQALVIGLFMGMLNVIPYVGPIIGMSFGFLVVIITQFDMNFYNELLPLLGYMFIVFIVIQIIDGTAIQPFIFSNSVKAHPLEIFILIMIAGTLAGILGMILAIPTYTILRVVAKEFLYRFQIVKRMTNKI